MINTTVLQASTTLSDWQYMKMDPQEIDDYVRRDLAQQLVDTILNEDLIQIHINKDLLTKTFTAQARLKIIQE